MVADAVGEGVGVGAGWAVARRLPIPARRATANTAAAANLIMGTISLAFWKRGVILGTRHSYPNGRGSIVAAASRLRAI